jgi:hypothetical protein
MKPANFPARVNDRRRSALARLLDDTLNHERSRQQRHADADRLALKLNGNARGIRSKKDRRAQARIAR